MTTPSPAPENRQYDLVLVDQSNDARDAARVEADARLTRELNEGGRLKKFVSGIWKGNIAKDYYRHKYQEQAHEQIVQSQDILLHESNSQEHRDTAMHATIQRFHSDYEEMIHQEAGENKEVIDSQAEIARSLKDIIREYAEGRLDETGLMEERARVLQAHREQNGHDLAGEGVVQIDNMLDIAQSVKGAIAHGESLDAIIDGMRVISGESRAGVRTELHQGKADKLIEKLSGSKRGLLLGSEATIAAVTIATSIARFGSKKVLGAAAMTIAPGVGAGILAGIRERKRVKEDRAQHAREMAQGKGFDPDARRRVQMETTRYETVAAEELIAQLSRHTEDGALGTDAALQEALDQLAAVETREHLSDSRGIDLIAYSSAVNVEDERFRLALARAQVKAALDGHFDDVTRQRLGLNATQTINEMIADRRDNYVSSHEDDITAKDQVFRKLSRRRVATAAAAGAAAGLTFGIVAQEAGAALSDSREGFVEQAWSHDSTLHNGSQHQTLLRGMLQGFEGGQGSGTSYAETSINGSDFSLSNNISIRENTDGTISLIGVNDKVIAENIQLSPDGSLSEQSQLLLRDRGLVVEDLSFTHTETKMVTSEVSLDEFLENHHGETTHVTRDFWYDNDTPAPNFDKNELGLHWGGNDGTGVTDDGSIQFTIASMRADGSFHDGTSANWASEADAGTLKLAISATSGSQARPFLVDLSPNGDITIAKDSPAAQFFKVEDGRTIFMGKYAEVVQMRGDSAGDSREYIRPLATYVGKDNLGSIVDTRPETINETLHQYKITAPSDLAGGDTFTEMAPVIPVVRRRSMENISVEPDTPYYYGYNLTPYEADRFRREECSPRLNRDPSVRLSPRQELEWRRQQIEKRQGKGYIDQVDAYIDASPELASLPTGTEAIVTIPVAAASEGENIYKTLRSYANQNSGLDKTTFLLHLNWFDQPKPGRTQDEHDEGVRHTMEAVEKARHDFPQLRIAVMQTKWSREAESRGEYGDGIIGHVARRMYDVAMMSVEKQMREDGNLDPTKDVLLIRNDSDAQGIQRTYLENMIKAMREHPENDVFTGAIRWGTDRHRDLPGLAVVSNFREIMHILASRKGIATWPPTVGINTAVRMSTFAAVGSVGDNQNRTGIGTDDYNIGGRIKDARQPIGRSSRRVVGYGGESGNTVVEGYGTRGLTTTDVFDYHRHVGGATIDTAADRLERAYVGGVPIHDAWSNWDNTTRTEGLTAGTKDDLKTMDGRNRFIAGIEKDLSASISHRFINRRQVMAGLAFVFPDPRYYRIELATDRRGVNFTLTPEGRKFLINRVQRDPKGRFDSIGRRVRRALYNEVSPGAKKQPLPPQAVMV